MKYPKKGLIETKNGIKKLFLCIKSVVFSVYLFLVLNVTLLSRHVSKNYMIKTRLFWSYKEWLGNGSRGLGLEIIQNIAMFVPFGFFVPVLLGGTKLKRKTKIRICFFTAVLFSAMIEVLQLVLKLGLFELDDIFNNTLGAAMGIGIFELLF